jgi:hypothetical protein
VFDVIDVVPEPGRPQTNHKLKPFFSTDEKNPVTSICGCNGYLLAAIGTKVRFIFFNLIGFNVCHGGRRIKRGGFSGC